MLKMGISLQTSSENRAEHDHKSTADHTGARSVAILAQAVLGRARRAGAWATMARECLRGVAAARFAADRLAQRLTRELAEARGEVARLRELLGSAPGSSATEAEARRREEIARPALVDKLDGRPVVGARRLRRNVALHARRCPPATAPLGERRQAQREVRLGARPPCRERRSRAPGPLPASERC